MYCSDSQWPNESYRRVKVHSNNCPIAVRPVSDRSERCRSSKTFETLADATASAAGERTRESVRQFTDDAIYFWTSSGSSRSGASGQLIVGLTDGADGNEVCMHRRDAASPRGCQPGVTVATTCGRRWQRWRVTMVSDDRRRWPGQQLYSGQSLSAVSNTQWIADAELWQAVSVVNLVLCNSHRRNVPNRSNIIGRRFCCVYRFVSSAGLTTRLTRLQPRAPDFLGPPKGPIPVKASMSLALFVKSVKSWRL